jgi:hypothetical protein
MLIIGEPKAFGWGITALKGRQSINEAFHGGGRPAGADRLGPVPVDSSGQLGFRGSRCVLF